MKYLILLMIGLSAGLFSFSQSETNFETDAFHAINVSHAFTVYLTQADDYSVTAEASKENMDKIHIGVDDGVLDIRMKSKYKWNSKKSNGEITVYISFPSIDALHISGAVELDATNQLKLDDLSFHASGASEVHFHVSCDDLEIELSGANELSMDIHADNVSLELSGANEIVFTGETDGFDIECSGASEISAGQLKADDVNIECSGASSIKVWADDDLSVNASGASAIYYHCSDCDDVHISTTGNASVKKY